MKRFAAPIAIAIAACVAPQAERTSARSDAIQGGKPETGSAFAVGVFDDQGSTCSGTLIAPNLVLTARHCIATDNGGDAVDCSHDVFAAPQAASTLAVSTDASASFDTAKLGVTKVVVPDDAHFCGHDIALLVLDKPVTSALASPSFDPKTYGSEVVAIGYGITSVTASDQGVRRRRDKVPIQCLPGDATLDCNPVDFGMVAAEMAAGSGLCDGDSGSGAYEPASLASGPLVIGVLSRGGSSGNNCTDAVYERLDGFEALLVATAKEAAASAGIPAPAWAGGSGEVDAATPDPNADAAGSDDASTAPTTSSSGGSAGGCIMHASSTSPSAAWALAIAALLLARRSKRARK